MGNANCCSTSKPPQVSSKDEEYIDTADEAPKGVSVHCISTSLLEEVQQMNLSLDSKIYEIEDLHSDSLGVIRSKGGNTTCPEDGRLGSSYVDALEGEDNVGTANIMLSYSWSYSIQDIASTLVDYCTNHNLDPKRTYVWICCLCINQHRVAESMQNKSDAVTFEDFRDIFHQRVTKIGHIVAMFAPWTQPLYLTRIWCVFEFYTANENKNCKVTITMPPDEKKAFLNAMENSSEGIDQLYSFLAKTKVENAQASVKEDRVRILKLIEEGPGFDTLNNAVNDCLRDWLKQVIVIEVESRERNSSDVQHDLDLARLYSVVAEILFRNGEKDQSLQLFEKALDIHKVVHGEDHESTATTYNSIGVNLKHLERFDEAINAYSKAASIREKVLGKNSPECASTYNNLGSLYSKMNRYNDGLVQFQKALEIRIRALGNKHADVANSYSNIGGALYQLGRYKEAQKEHEKGLDIKLKLYGEDHPDTAASYENIGLVYKQEGDSDAAIENLEKAYSIRAKILGKTHMDTVKVEKILRELELDEEESIIDELDEPMMMQAFEMPEPLMVQTMEMPPEPMMMQTMEMPKTP